jgi:transcriptional regulator with XRE-family HTH domain
MPYGLPWTEKLIDQLSEKEYRDEFVADQVRGRIALLVRALREQEGRKWSQTDLGERMGKPQSVVSRIENPDHKVSLQTLLEVAAGFDLPLYVDILDWDDWFRRMSDFSTDKMHRQSFDAERLIAQTQAAAHGITNGNIAWIEGAKVAQASLKIKEIDKTPVKTESPITNLSDPDTKFGWPTAYLDEGAEIIESDLGPPNRLRDYGESEGRMV